MYFWRLFYIFASMFVFLNFAQAGSENYISREEFEIIKSDFVRVGCNIEGILSSAERLNVSNVYDDGGQIEPLISTLSKPALCLISRSSDFLVDYKIMTPKGIVEKTVYDKFPRNGNVVDVIFRLPYKISKQCDEDGVVAFFITFSKKDGKLQRKIYLTDDLLDCNIRTINIPKNFKN
ncbi:hypothetical protein [Iodobacter ciconiae]|uniref:Uncharacterized protein n=1 Tax=Iodobacter ciconiae TaxID=2496266 RepID=A0A3S8ZPD2_9NEIS|nr:hypothetical protein [Iodobacter ciconiae]AZN35324.1 hypothetical protein EJO50_01755 [Iodobacter ciconiae]